jgi:hypothetical protein
LPKVDENGGVCGEMKLLHIPRVKPKIESPKKNQASLNNGSKGCNKRKWGQGKLRPLNDKEKSTNKELPIKKVKQDLSKVKCFNYDNNGHLTKDCPKPPWM